MKLCRVRPNCSFSVCALSPLSHPSTLLLSSELTSFLSVKHSNKWNKIWATCTIFGTWTDQKNFPWLRMLCLPPLLPRNDEWSSFGNICLVTDWTSRWTCWPWHLYTTSFLVVKQRPSCPVTSNLRRFIFKETSADGRLCCTWLIKMWWSISGYGTMLPSCCVSVP